MIPIKDNIPTDRFPLATVALILANVVVYLLAIRHGGSLIAPDLHELVQYGARPDALRAETALTSLFVHGSIIHLAGNMLFLWIFGNTIEGVLGAVRFVALYLLGGLAAVALELAAGPGSSAPTIGPAGAIAGVLGGYAVLYPRGRVLTLVLIPLFFTVIELPVVVMLALWFAEQVLFALAHLTSPTGDTGAAFLGQAGSFLVAAATIRLLAPGRRTLQAR